MTTNSETSVVQTVPRGLQISHLSLFSCSIGGGAIGVKGASSASWPYPAHVQSNVEGKWPCWGEVQWNVGLVSSNCAGSQLSVRGRWAWSAVHTDEERGKLVLLHYCRRIGAGPPERAGDSHCRRTHARVHLHETGKQL